MIRVKNAIKRRWQRCTNELERSQLKSELNRIQRTIASNVRHELNVLISKQISSFSKGSRSMWQLTKRMRGKSDNNATKIRTDGQATIDDNDRANFVAKNFEKSHQITINYKHENDQEIKTTINSFQMFSYVYCQPPQIEIDEIQKIIRSLKPFKAPGIDSIQNVLLKNLPIAAIAWLTNVFNKCLSLSYWPKNFKMAKVIPILKAGKPPTDATSYRPISLLNATGKLLKRLVHTQLIKFVEERNLLPDFQFGLGGATQQFIRRPK